MGSNFEGEKFDFQDLELFSLHAVWTGADGTDGTSRIWMEASNNGQDWAPIANTSLDFVVATPSDNCIYDSNGPFCTQYIRVMYQAGDTTTGTLKLLLLGKSTK